MFSVNPYQSEIHSQSQQGHNYFHNNTKMLFLFSSVLTSALDGGKSIVAKNFNSLASKQWHKNELVKIIDFTEAQPLNTFLLGSLYDGMGSTHKKLTSTGNQNDLQQMNE